MNSFGWKVLLMNLKKQKNKLTITQSKTAK